MEGFRVCILLSRAFRSFLGSQGTNVEQDGRWGDKEKKLMASMKFPANFSQKVDMKKVNLPMIEPWITERITHYMGFEDDVLVEYIMSLLQQQEDVDPRRVQIQITGFLARKAGPFMGELWHLLLDAQNNLGGIPTELIEKKKAELKQKKVSCLLSETCIHR